MLEIWKALDKVFKLCIRKFDCWDVYLKTSMSQTGTLWVVSMTKIWQFQTRWWEGPHLNNFCGEPERVITPKAVAEAKTCRIFEKREYISRNYWQMKTPAGDKKEMMTYLNSEILGAITNYCRNKINNGNDKKSVDTTILTLRVVNLITKPNL